MPSYTSIIVTDYDSLSRSELDLLIAQNVDIDDWDFMIFFKTTSDVFDKEGNFSDWQLKNIFNNRIDDVKILQNIKFREDTWFLGVYYH